MPHVVRTLQVQISIVVLLFLAAGCGGGGGSAYKGPTGLVTGKLIIDGKPLTEGCHVAFQSVEGGYLAVGTVKSEGKYTLTCNGSFNVPAVAYRIQLAPPSSVETITTTNKLQDPSEMARKVMGPPGSAKVKESAKPPFPAKYLNTLTSKLEYTVKAGSNTADFDLSP
jgi:hypothetical protein